VEKSEPVREGRRMEKKRTGKSAGTLFLSLQAIRAFLFWLEFMSQLAIEFTVQSWIWNVSHTVNGKCF